MPSGRLDSSALGRAIRTVWQRTYKLRAISGDVRHEGDLRLSAGSVIRGVHPLRIGRDVQIGRNCTIEVGGSIGNHVLLAGGVAIVGRVDHAMHEVGVPMTQSTWIGDRFPTDRDLIDIEDDVWIGYGAIILSGTKIGAGSVIAAGAVVTRNVPPNSIAGGNPARIIGTRFNDIETYERHKEILLTSTR